MYSKTSTSLVNRVCRKQALPFLETRYARNSRACYQKHSHPTFSLGIVESGKSHYTNGRHTQALMPGSVAVIAADRVHSCNPAPEQCWSYHTLYIDNEWLMEASREIAEVNKLRKRPSGTLNIPPMVGDPGLYRGIIALNQTMFSDLPVLSTHTALLGVVDELILKHSKVADPALVANNHPAVAKVREYLHENLTIPVTLDELSSVAGLSPYYLIRAFKQCFGLTPHAYQIDARINYAKQLLRKKRSLAEIAAETGFSDQPHFQRSFKRHTAMTPAQYQSACG